ncbi:MAG TPA: Rieske 2Fe-2S domain-containing protein [Acidimicrobiia bacterium]|nr:Rieske 2Fe-2S domain-containing protein [Acidimicrobiia bacterium]
MTEGKLGLPYRTFPTGWFQLAWRDEIEPGRAVPLTRFGEELVAFRGESGELHVFDAYCPHFGAHLGYGGCVEGDDIVCPFHQWRFGPDGRVTDIPYSQRRQTANRLRPWPVVEVETFVFVWYDAQSRPPLWDPPPPNMTGRSVYPGRRLRYDDLRMHPQMMIENACDAAHFKSVHRARDVPEVTDYGEDGSTFWIRLDWPNGGHMRNELYGVSMAFGVWDGVFPKMGNAYTWAAVTPVTNETCTFFIEEWTERRPDDPPTIPPETQRYYDAQDSQSLPDQEIWRHMRWTPTPALTPEESHIRALHKWTQQFYPSG